MITIYLFISAWAAYCAWDDRQQIQRGENIHHRLQWFIRCLVAVGLVAVVAASWSQATFLAIGSGALFSMVFRYCLNRMRGLDWRYISPSSWYDYVYLVISGAWSWKPNGWKWKNWQGLMRNSHTGSILFDSQYQSSVYRAGLIAYALELVVLVACSYLSSVL
jgi:hypothetical protein